MKNHYVWIVLVAAVAAFAAAGGEWYHAGERLRELRAGELEPLAALLKEDQELLQVLQVDSAADKAVNILGTYLAAIRADGLPKHAEMKQRLERLAENNAGVLALINAYIPHAKTAPKLQRTSKALREGSGRRVGLAATLSHPASLRTSPHRFVTPYRCEVPVPCAVQPTLPYVGARDNVARPVSAFATVLLTRVRWFELLALTLTDRPSRQQTADRCLQLRQMNRSNRYMI